MFAVYFNGETTQAVLGYIQERYDVRPEFLWERSPDSAALRHPHTKKWFGALMNIPRRKLGLDQEGTVDILDLKCWPELGGSLRDGKRIFPGYHMNKEHWITLLLDGTLPLEEITPLIDLSWQITSSGGKKKGRKG